MRSDNPATEWQPGGGLLIWVLLLLAPVAEAVQIRHGSAWWVIALVVLYGATYCLVVRQVERGVPARVRYPVLVVFVLGGLALATVFSLTSVFVVVFTSIAVAISLPLARPAFLGLLAVTAAAMAVAIPGGIFAILGLGFGTYIAGFVTFVMRELYVTIGELRRARRELATAAVAQERLRFARDLHDLLGHSLSVIVVKAELIRRTASLDPGAAATAAADIELVGRRALLEVRDAVSGYRRTDLRTELARAEHALSDAGIATTVQVPDGAIDPDAGEILGWAVREGATNVLRHSGAGRCAITVRADPAGTELTVADDGPGQDRDQAPIGAGAGAFGRRRPGRSQPEGNGLRGLRERVAAADGTLDAGRSGSGQSNAGQSGGQSGNELPGSGRFATDSPYEPTGFVLRVRLPPTPERAGDPDSADSSDSAERVEDPRRS